MGLLGGEAAEGLGGDAVAVGTPGGDHDGTHQALDQRRGAEHHPLPDVVGDTLGLTEDQMAASRRVLTEHGNCSSATVLLVLEELGDVDGPVVAMAFGPGLTLYATLLLPA